VIFITNATLHILRLLRVKLDNVSTIRYNIRIQQKEGHQMNLEEYKAHVLATRKANAEKAMSVLSATIIKKEKEGDN
jgi:hypothetical protein